MCHGSEFLEQERTAMHVRSLMTRQKWLLVHRYIGLVMTSFLLVSGLTGCLLAFYDELDTAINADAMTVAPPSPDAQPLDPRILREQLLVRYPNARIHWVNLTFNPGRAWTYFLDPATDPVSGR
ncbi:MAG: hypothetical protein NPIRA02_13480 [Nitrospirales bacterium]|nr:MAG: hypothetical protein NPIRA02_13480 [Nitrospirales bacterium]